MEEEVQKIEKYVQTPHVYGLEISFYRYGVKLADPSFDIFVREEDEGVRKMLDRRVLRRATVTDDDKIFENSKILRVGETEIRVLSLSDLLLMILREPRPLPELVSCIPVSLALFPDEVDVEYVIRTSGDPTLLQKLGLLFDVADYLNPSKAVKRKLRVLRRFYPFEAVTWILGPPPATSQREGEKDFRKRNRIVTLQSFWRVEQTPLMEEFEAEFRLYVPEESMKWRYEPRITKKFSERGIRVRRMAESGSAPPQE